MVTPGGPADPSGCRPRGGDAPGRTRARPLRGRLVRPCDAHGRRDRGRAGRRQRPPSEAGRAERDHGCGRERRGEDHDDRQARGSLGGEGRAVSLAESDTFRAAAGEQLKIWAHAPAPTWWRRRGGPTRAPWRSTRCTRPRRGGRRADRRHRGAAAHPPAPDGGAREGPPVSTRPRGASRRCSW